jgi:hypothetical protein
MYTHRHHVGILIVVPAADDPETRHYAALNACADVRRALEADRTLNGTCFDLIIADTPDPPEMWEDPIPGVASVLMATLFIGWVDTQKSYRSMIADMTRAMPSQHRCMASRDVGEAQRAMLHYFAGIRTLRIETRPKAVACDLLLVQGRPLDEQMMTAEWKKIWEVK